MNNMKKMFQEDVDGQCNALRVAGVPIRGITGSLVWKNLGGIGSRTTAYDMVRDWKMRLDDRSAVQVLVFSDTARQQIVAICERVASTELETERQATAVENAALQDELEAVRGERDDLVRAVAELETTNADHADALRLIRGEFAEMTAALATAVVEVKLLKADRAQLLASFADRVVPGPAAPMADDSQPGLFDSTSSKDDGACQR